MNSKQIQVVVRYAYPLSTGMEVNNVQTYRYFVKRGWTVNLYTTKDDGSGNNVLANAGTVYGINLHRVESLIYKFLPWRMGVNLSDRTILCLHGSDIFPFYYFFIVSILLKIFGKKKFKLIYTPHGIFTLNANNSSSIKIVIKTIIDTTIGSLLINHSVDNVRAVSEWEKKTLIKSGIDGHKITVIHNGLDPLVSENIESKIDSETKNQVDKLGTYLIQLGRITNIKNQSTAIKALGLLPPYVKMVFVGPVEDQNYKDNLDKLIVKLKLSDRVIFTGAINGDEKYYYIKQAIAMLHLSTLEGYSNSVNEALSLGIPCIVSRNTALEDQIVEGINGYLVASNDYVMAAEKIKIILDPRHRTQISEIRSNNIRKVKGHTWENISFELERRLMNSNY